MTEKRNLYSQSLHPNGRDKGAIISMETYQYNIIITIGNDPLTGDNDNYVLEKKSNIE